MFDPRFPWLAVGALTVFATGVMLYYVALVGGWYKDPMMERFRMYGAERRPYPLCRLLDVWGWWSLMIASMLDSLVQANNFTEIEYAPVIFLAMTLLAWGGSTLVRSRPALREALPRWYFDLLRTATRQERRFIGYAWLRIPRKMRWRLNGDQAAFRTWADMVRITVTYGAYDPANPWNRWT